MPQRYQPKHDHEHNVHSNAADGVSPFAGFVAQILRHPLQSSALFFVLSVATLFFPLSVLLCGQYFRCPAGKNLPARAGRQRRSPLFYCWQ